MKNDGDRLTRRPFHVAPADKVQMQVEDRLAGLGTNVVHRSVALLDPALASEFGGDELAVADDFRVFRRGLFQASDVALGDDEHMRRSLWIDVFEDEHFVVFVDLLGGDFTGNDLAEEAVVAHIQMLADNGRFDAREMVVRLSYHGDQGFYQGTSRAPKRDSPPAWAAGRRSSRCQDGGRTYRIDAAKEAVQEESKNRQGPGYRVSSLDARPRSFNLDQQRSRGNAG